MVTCLNDTPFWPVDAYGVCKRVQATNRCYRELHFKLTHLQSVCTRPLVINLAGEKSVFPTHNECAGIIHNTLCLIHNLRTHRLHKVHFVWLYEHFYLCLYVWLITESDCYLNTLRPHTWAIVCVNIAVMSVCKIPEGTEVNAPGIKNECY